ncbi:MAG TPA: NPCBM/NEW2 domain-containing protein [Pirellulales bacterium]|jgi:hypothetical protein|nr:NPCBM/NEW2 domain-containing protein [Pirellulales bacterium]
MNLLPERRGLLAIAFALAIAMGRAQAETVRTVDDKAISGTIAGFDSDAILVQQKTDNSKPVRIPLAEIVDVSFGEGHTVAAPAMSKPKPSPLSAIGGLFGISSAQTTEAYSTPYAAANGTSAYARSTYAQPPAITIPHDASPVLPAPRISRRGVVIWQFEFAGGDAAYASLDKWAADSVRLTFDSFAGSPIAVPVDRIRAIWSSSPAMVKKAKDLNQSAEGQDVAFIEKAGDVKAVPGLAEGLDGGFLKFKFEGESRRIKLDRLAGILLSQREIAADKSLYEAFALPDGDRLFGRIEAIESGVLRFKPICSAGADAARVEIPLKQLKSIEVRNGRLAWLGDLRPSAVVQVPYFDRLMPYRVNQSLTGGALVLADGPVAKGIAVHTRCTLTYDIAGAFGRFRAKVGFQQPEGKIGRASVRVMGDGKMLWQQADLRGDASKPAAIDVDVANIKSLSLEADYGPNFDVAGRIVWGEARLIRQ